MMNKTYTIVQIYPMDGRSVFNAILRDQIYLPGIHLGHSPKSRRDL